MNYNKLTPAETERLACLAEECAEVIQAVGKILRHGYEEFNLTLQKRMENRLELEKEMGDLRYSMIAMCEAGDVDKERIHTFADSKRNAVKQWLHHQ